MDTCEVTQAAFQALMGRNPAKSVGPDKPVERVSWRRCRPVSATCDRTKEGLKPCYDLKTFQCDFAADGYRLPTEAEWEYACRAGTPAAWSFGDDPAELAKYGWVKGNSEKTTHPVKQKQPNAWGLYDMYGNVAEWCNDFYSESYDPTDSKDPHGPASGTERGDARRQLRGRRRHLPLVGAAEPNARLRRHVFRLRDVWLPLRSPGG